MTRGESTAHGGFFNVRVCGGWIIFLIPLALVLLAVGSPRALSPGRARNTSGQLHRPNGGSLAPSGSVYEAWVVPYIGQAQAVAVDASGNVYVTGFTVSQHEYLTIKYDSAGQEQWIAQYSGPGNDDYARAIALDDFGNVLVTGYSRRFPSGDMDFATIKYNSAGQEQWVARYNSPSNGYDLAYAIAIDSAANVYVTGGGFGYATVKYNSAGQEQWVAHYTGNDTATSIAVDGSGNVYITGGGYGDYATIKYNSFGQQQWVATYNGPGNGDDYALAIAIDGLGDVYVTGQSVGLGSSWDYATIKYNASGQQQWVARYNGPANDIDSARALALDDSGNVYVTGFSTGVGSAYDYATVKYNSAGQQQWLARYNGPGSTYDAPYAIAIDGSANAYVTGYGGTSHDYTTIKYSSDGQQQWIARYSSGTAYAIALDGLGNVYATGASSTIKYVQGPAPTATASPTPTATFTPTPTPTFTPTSTATATAMATATATPALTPTPTSTPRPTPTPRTEPTPRGRPTPPPRP